MTAENELLESVGEVAAMVRDKQRVTILHHNDADGLCAGAILFTAFRRAGATTRGYCLEKPYPAVLDSIVEHLFEDGGGKEDSLLLLADFGSGMIHHLAAKPDIRNRVLVLDHHQVSDGAREGVRLLNPLLHDLRGDQCSASALAYQLAVALSEHNRDMAVSGFVGALGDGFVDSAGRLYGVNALAFEDAAAEGLADHDTSYTTELAKDRTAEELVDDLNALGSFGYFSGGPDVAMKGLAEGFDDRYYDRARTLRDEFESKLDDLIRKGGIIEGKLLKHFSLGVPFQNMGVKTVGLACEKVRDSSPGDSHYILGFQHVPDRIPGLGPVNLSQTKISMRVPKARLDDIAAGRAPNLLEVLPPATEKVGGFVDACHPHAAATTVPVGKEYDVLYEVEAILQERLSD